MKNFIRILLLLILPGSFLSQSSDYNDWPKDEQKKLENAKALMEEKMYVPAYHRFKSLLEKHPEDFYLKYLVGICAIYQNDKREEAGKYLEEVKKNNDKAADLDYYYAIYYHRNYEFDKSVEIANTLITNPKLSADQLKTLQQLLKYCANAKELIASPVNSKIEPIGSPPNTESAEYSPVLTSDEETIYFTYRGVESKGGLQDMLARPNPDGIFFEDIFKTGKSNGVWQKPMSIGENNTNSNDAVIAISNDGQQMFIFRADEKDGGDIYLSHLKGKTFGIAEKLKGQINTNAWEGSISLSGDQKKVIFASERPGGYGGKDLYSANLLPDGSWGDVTNLGDKINTWQDEDAPFLHPDGRTLVFSSKGHNSMGEYDIFLSDINEADSSWKNPVNIGYPINTTDDDIYYVISADGRRGYYASAKKGGKGDKDIYVVEPALPNKKSYLTIIKGKITENLIPFSANVNVFHANGRGYGIYESNSESGNYLVSLPSGFNYKLSFYHPVFGEKTFDVITEKVDGHAEKIVDVNFGANDTTAKHQTITFEPPVVAKPKDSVPPTVDIAKEKGDLKNMTRDQIFEKYGNVKVDGLNFHVQVGAYKYPGNFKRGKFKGLCTIVERGALPDGITLLETDKVFDTWKDAVDFLNRIKNAGQNDAFVTAYYNGTRYYMRQIFEMSVWVKPNTPL